MWTDRASKHFYEISVHSKNYDHKYMVDKFSIVVIVHTWAVVGQLSLCIMWTQWQTNCAGINSPHSWNSVGDVQSNRSSSTWTVLCWWAGTCMYRIGTGNFMQKILLYLYNDALHRILQWHSRHFVRIVMLVPKILAAFFGAVIWAKCYHLQDVWASKCFSRLKVWSWINKQWNAAKLTVVMHAIVN